MTQNSRRHDEIKWIAGSRQQVRNQEAAKALCMFHFVRNEDVAWWYHHCVCVYGSSSEVQAIERTPNAVLLGYA